MTREIAAAGEDAALRVPPGLSAFFARRLDSLGATSREVLRTAAIIGREFSYQEVLTASGLDADHVLAGLDDASGSHLIAEAGGPGHFEFVHALMRQAVTDSMTPGQRGRLHGRVGAALEAAGAGSSAEGQATLAEHYRESAAFNAAHAGKAYHFSEAAAANAEHHYAWSVAMAHYRYCLELESAGHAPGDDRAWLLTRLATCQLRLVHPKTLATAQEAMSLYRARGDGPGFARAALTALEHPATWDNQFTLTIAGEALALLGEVGGELEGRLLAMVAEYWIFRDPYSAGEPDWLVRLRGAAAKHPLPRLTGCLHYVAAARARARGDFEAVYRESMKAHEAFDRAGEYLRAGTAMLHAGDALMWMGRLDEAAATGFEEMEFASRKGAPFQVDEGAALAVSVALMRGASAVVDGILGKVGAASGPTVFTRPRLLELSGDASSAIPAFRAALSTQTQNGYQFGIQPSWFGTLARLLFSAGELDEAQSWLRRWDEAYRAIDAWDPFYSLRAIISASDALVALGTPDVQRLVYRRLDILRDFRSQSSFGLDRLRGDLATALGSPAEAAAWYELGLAWAAEAGSPIEEGLNLRGLAQIAAGEGRVGDAMALGRQAADALQQAGAILYLRPMRDWLDSLGTTSPGGKREQTEHVPGGLSQREADVVRLVAGGASNHMIADELVISPATVARHISNILIKLNLTNRTEVATWALRHGIAREDQ